MLPAGVSDESSPLPELQMQSAVRPALPAELPGEARVTDQQPAEATRSGAPAWLDTDLGIPPARRRNRLPEPKQKLPSLNIFALVKDWIGAQAFQPSFAFTS